MGKSGWLALALVIAAPVAASAMGALGGDVPSSIPSPARNFVFTVTDEEGLETRLEQFSIEGLLYLSGRHGKATVAIPFERISRVQLQAREGELHAMVATKDGKDLELVVDGRRRCYGRMQYANFQIELRNLEKMVNHGPSAPGDRRESNPALPGN